MYLGPLSNYLKIIWGIESNEDILIVGHNLGISDLVSYFTEEFIEMQTAEYICIDFELDSWIETSKGLGTISVRFHL